MNSIRVDIRLRPILFGFLVRPDDAEKVLEIFRVNTCLWGGIFNPIIPFFESVPSWLEEGGFRVKDPDQIINGYLELFQPDILVEAEEGLADEFGFNEERVIQLTNILDLTNQMYGVRYGLGVDALYSELYREVFQFELRHKRDIVHVEAKESVFSGFVAAVFGSFPIPEQLRYFEHNSNDFPVTERFRYFEHKYKEAFNPEHITLDAAALSKLYKSGYSSPFEIGYTKLRIDYHDRGELRLFILDAHDPKDLIEFWNLRIIHQHVLAVPIQWIKELSPLCKEIIRARYASTIFSPSISETDREDIHNNYLRVDERSVYRPQIGYLPIWMKDRAVYPTLEGDRKSLNIQIDEDNPEIQFEPLFPKFADEYINRFCLVNVIRLQDWSHTGQIATVFPCNYKNPTLPQFGFGWEHLLPTIEGLVIFPHRSIPEQWHLVDGTTVFNEWFNDKQVPATLSDAGRSTQQIIQTLGGILGVSHLVQKNVIEYLNKISKRPITKTADYQPFQNKLGRRISEVLLERKAVELGLKLKCSKCGEWNWYSLTQLDYSLACSLCLRQFEFPVIEPTGKKHSKWAYRVVGPFAQPDYAKGGYSAALAIRFFADVIGRTGRRSAVTWSSGQELKLSTHKMVEADFILWYQRKEDFRTDYPTETVFGEAKSFSRFEQKDVDNMKLLAQKFPGSILVFATMKEELSQKEISRIKKLAEWGRKYDKERKQTRAPVIVLTETELFTEMFFEKSWEDKGGKHKDLIQSWKGSSNLRLLADLTQELYLGMPPYESSRPTGETTWLPAEPSTKKPEKD